MMACQLLARQAALSMDAQSEGSSFDVSHHASTSKAVCSPECAAICIIRLQEGPIIQRCAVLPQAAQESVAADHVLKTGDHR